MKLTVYCSEFKKRKLTESYSACCMNWLTDLPFICRSHYCILCNSRLFYYGSLLLHAHDA